MTMLQTHHLAELVVFNQLTSGPFPVSVRPVGPAQPGRARPCAARRKEQGLLSPERLKIQVR